MKSLQPYPNNLQPTMDSLLNALQQITRIRQDDQSQWNSLTSQFIAGRKVTKVPASATDITGSAIGDFNATATYAYFCVNDGSGNAIWRRVAVASW